MTVQAIANSLTDDQQRQMLELLWDRFVDTGPEAPPDWHEEVLSERLSCPSPSPAVPLDQGIEEVRRRLNGG